MLIRGRHYRSGEPIELAIEAGIVHGISARTTRSIDYEAEWIAPGLTDLQINGCLGVGYNSDPLTSDDVCKSVREIARHGVTGFLATLVTHSEAAWTHALGAMMDAIKNDPFVARRLIGFHLEGPAISPLDGPRGAHPAQHIRPANGDEFARLQDLAQGRIRMVTLAPEAPGVLQFIEKHAQSEGMLIALAHTNANARQIRDAVKVGARLSTHLGNACPYAAPRHQEAFWEQLNCDDLAASVIADGHHLPPALLNIILRLKSPGRTVLISDASSLAGLPPGEYVEWGLPREVTPDGRIAVPGTSYLAGAGLFLDHCISYLVQTGCANLADAIDMASLRSRELLGLAKPEFFPGSPANFVLFDMDHDQRIIVRHTIA